MNKIIIRGDQHDKKKIQNDLIGSISYSSLRARARALPYHRRFKFHLCTVHSCIFVIFLLSSCASFIYFHFLSPGSLHYTNSVVLCCCCCYSFSFSLFRSVSFFVRVLYFYISLLHFSLSLSLSLSLSFD